MIWIISWLLLGFVTAALVTWLQLKSGMDISLGDGLLAIVATILGPIFAVVVIWTLLEESQSAGEKIILIKAKKKT